MTGERLVAVALLVGWVMFTAKIAGLVERPWGEMLSFIAKLLIGFCIGFVLAHVLRSRS